MHLTLLWELERPYFSRSSSNELLPYIYEVLTFTLYPFDLSVFILKGVGLSPPPWLMTNDDLLEFYLTTELKEDYLLTYFDPFERAGLPPTVKVF